MGNAEVPRLERAEKAEPYRDHILDLNATFRRHLSASPRELFAVERAKLKRLPIWVPEVYDLHHRIVDSEGYVNVYGSKYSVPWKLIGRQLEVRETKDRIEVYDGPRCVASHQRLWSHMAERVRVTLPEHPRRSWAPTTTTRGPMMNDELEQLLRNLHLRRMHEILANELAEAEKKDLSRNDERSARAPPRPPAELAGIENLHRPWRNSRRCSAASSPRTPSVRRSAYTRGQGATRRPAVSVASSREVTVGKGRNVSLPSAIGRRPTSTATASRLAIVSTSTYTSAVVTSVRYGAMTDAATAPVAAQTTPARFQDLPASAMPDAMSRHVTPTRRWGPGLAAAAAAAYASRSRFRSTT